MADSKKDDKEYSVTSKPTGSRRNVTFSVPTLPRPDIKRHARGPVGIIVAFILVAVLSGFGGGLLANHSSNGVLTSGSVSTQKKIVSSQSQLISQIAKTVGPSVVSVNVCITSSGGGPAADGLFGFAQPQSEQAAGTGIIISSSGLIVTNRHVVPEGTTNVSVTLSDGTELKDVTVIGRTGSSDSLDVAFLKINNTQGHKLAAATIGDSSKVEVGDDAVAIGNALGQFQNTVTSGIISGYGRSVTASDSSGSSASAENLDNLFQTDAAINEGNSGGPLVNLNGQVIGINTATAGNAQNIGFAIPINDVKGLINQVLKSGKFERPYLGVRYIPLTADIAKEYDLNVQKGAFVAPSSDASSPSVIADSPADKAGVKERDIIATIDDTDIDQTHSLTSILSQHQPGDKVTLTVLRDGKTLHLKATVGTVPTASQQ
ncbi:MAG TPA: trypsin-like peptidase domain-containing protein [Candidatus Saccharimonadales bacterium]